LPSAAIDRDPFGDGQTAESAWVQGIDLATPSRFRDSSGKSLARRGPAAWVSVITDARHPGAGCLRVGEGTQENRGGEHVETDCRYFHEKAP
jgi:hypothetical protein